VKEMNRDENQIHYASKRERLLGLTIFLLLIMSFFFHLCAFGEIFFKNNQMETKSIKNISYFICQFLFSLENNTISIKLDDLFDINLLPFFCILAHLIWTIVPIVVLDQCCILNNKSISKIILKLVICTFPLLLCSELSIIFVCHIHFLKNDFLIVTMKWFIFIATIFICFWTGILSDKNKWRGIHGGQIAPELNSPLDLFQN